MAVRKGRWKEGERVTGGSCEIVEMEEEKDEGMEGRIQWMAGMERKG